MQGVPYYMQFIKPSQGIVSHTKPALLGKKNSVRIMHQDVSFHSCSFGSNIMVVKLLLNFGGKFQYLYSYMRNLRNLIGLEQWYFSSI